MAGMEDAWVRLNRAKTNFKTLDDVIAAFPRDHPHTNTVGVEHDGKGHVRLVARIKQRPPSEWGLAAGDILVDLRCALDYAVYALAIANSNVDPPTSADRLEFPICETPTRWAEAIGRRKLDGVSAAAIDYIASVQPYQPGRGGSNSGLLALEELVGIYKHRFVYIAWSRLHSLSLEMNWHGAQPVDFGARHIPGELKDGAELGSFRIDVTAADAKVEIDATLATFVAIEPTSKGWLNLREFLGGMGGDVELHLRELEARL